MRLPNRNVSGSDNYEYKIFPEREKTIGAAVPMVFQLYGEQSFGKKGGCTAAEKMRTTFQ